MAMLVMATVALPAALLAAALLAAASVVAHIPATVSYLSHMPFAFAELPYFLRVPCDADRYPPMRWQFTSSLFSFCGTR
jgi:hypothetical protein